MIAAISLIVIVLLSVLITRIATIALAHTGLSRESSKFQARSALTGSGFTTTESEKVVNHPVRRKIILLLMLIGNAGLVTVISSLILTFVASESKGSLILSVVIIVVGIIAIWWIGQSQLVDKFLSRIINNALKKYTSLNVRDFSALLHLSDDYRIVELYVKENDWISDKTIAETKLNQEGILVLSVQRHNQDFIGAPTTSTQILTNDVLTIYGKASACEMLDKRKKGYKGDKEHKKAVSEHSKLNTQVNQEDTSN